MPDKPSMLMFVYGNLATDARVQRSLDTLSQKFDITILSTGEAYNRESIRNVIFETNRTGPLGYLDTVRQVIHYGKKHKFQYLYLHDYYSCLVGLKLYKNHKTIYDAHELIINTKEYPVSLRDRFFGFLEKKLITKVQLIICAEKNRSKMMKNYYQLESSPFVVPNYSELSVSPDYILTAEMIDFFQDQRKTIVYAGALVADRHIESILYGVAKLSTEYKVLIIGEGSGRPHLEQIAREFSGLKCLFTGSIPYMYLGKILQRCDVGYLSYPITDLNNIYCAPNKIYEYASVELPMICNNNPNLISIVGVNGIGLCVSEKESQGCVASIEEALEIINRDYEKYKKNIQAFRHDNSWDAISRLYLEKVQSL